ncbi:MAG: zinc ribbon domain-containing protein [Thermoleophilia bacterium]|nr:zinc ribbon domain-containing protein [Thermoleophilia bacterium]
MPTYDLRCTDCTQQFEVFRQGFLRDEDRTCPECGAAAEHLITGFVTSRPVRVGAAVGGGASGGHGHTHGTSCGCGGP